MANHVFFMLYVKYLIIMFAFYKNEIFHSTFIEIFQGGNFYSRTLDFLKNIYII